MTVIYTDRDVSLHHQADGLSVRGDVDVTSAAALAAEGSRWLVSQLPAAVSFDFSDVATPRNVALSVLLQWLRTCHQQHIDVTAIALSAPLERLAGLAELDALIKSPDEKPVH
ncbi:STAS domain-containing protein [Vreelandella arcis]|uniref:Phospholipid transport system transporter-binding protein n=1 Tax=Vreelandella arcis TaxID=416873 RepID=A0A1G9ZIX2_9GAMM|nr:STAS domain-containing protein [Halomonas arcis]SDN21047.1 phospholipid transport system transporter-binding protein [Halomonas arcis]